MRVTLPPAASVNLASCVVSILFLVLRSLGWSRRALSRHPPFGTPVPSCLVPLRIRLDLRSSFPSTSLLKAKKYDILFHVTH
mmetsp:Transcript_25359/g.66540  ORF Transcript_25359/g.66540 Transcript_25359/m.66540 type:complete len:82 (-) Transcript_25359:11-256(-)